MYIDFIITGKNNAANTILSIKSCLEMKEDFEKIKIYYVDDNSEDMSVSEACKAGAEVYLNEGNNLGSARNTAYKRSRGEYLVFLESGHIINRDFVKKAINFMEVEKKADVVWGHLVEKYSENCPYRFVCDLDKIREEGYKNIFLDDFIIKRNVVDEVGLYRGKKFEDSEIDFALKVHEKDYKIYAFDDILSQSINEKEYLSLIKKAYRKSYRDLSINRLHPYYKSKEIMEISICGTIILLFTILSFYRIYLIFFALFTLLKPIFFRKKYMEMYNLSKEESELYIYCKILTILPRYYAQIIYFFSFFKRKKK